MGSKKAVKVGYRYLFGIHQGFGRGPMDEMVEIKVGGKVAWTGSVTENQTITIDKPELFGGDDGEGGIKGTMDVMMGGPEQPRNERLAAMLGGIVPAFRGVCTAFYDGLVTSLNPYPKTWSFRWRRALAGWDGEPWYPEKAVIWLADGTIRAMNPAHILYEAETNRDWGRKKDRSRLDDATWRAAADQLYEEGFGLCLRWVRQDSVNAFMGHVLDHIAGNLFPSRTTGLMKLTLVRNDYDPESLPLFTPDTGLLGIDEDDNAADAGSINEIVVKWRSPIDDQVRQVRERNLAAVRSAGGDIISQTIEYLGLPTHALAGRVAVRDLQAKIGAKRWKLRLDRRAFQIEPGGVFRFSDPRRGLENIVVRAGRSDDGTHTSGAITITALLDVFGLPATSFTTPPPSNWVPPNTTPAAAAIRRVAETTWRDLAQTIDAANLALVDPTACFIGAMAVRPTGLSLGYVIQTRVGSAAYETRAEGDFCPSGLLLAAISAAPGPTIIQLTGTEGLGQVALGSAALLDGEIVRIDAIDLGTNTLTIGRGCIDTVAAAHAAGARLWFFDDFASADPTEYSPSVTVQARLLPHTSSGSLDPVLAPTDTLVMAQRQARPYPPGQFQLGGVSYPASIVGDVVLTWAHRDRLLQADQLVDTTLGSIGPEAGTTYSCRLLRADTSVVLDSETGISGTTATLAAAYAGEVIAELWSVRDGLESWQRWRHTFQLIQPGEADPYWANVVALLHFDGANNSTTFTDVKGKTWTAVGDAKLSTTTPNYGTACLLVDGAGDGVSSASHADFEFGSGNFTIEFYFMPAAAASAIVTFIERWNLNGVYMNATADGRLFAGAQNTTSGAVSVIEATSSWSVGTWAHFAFVRNGNQLLAFKNGVLLGTATFTGAINAITEPFAFGYDNSGARYFNGRLDELRITKGVARYTGTFTPPSAPFPNH